MFGARVRQHELFMASARTDASVETRRGPYFAIIRLEQEQRVSWCDAALTEITIGSDIA